MAPAFGNSVRTLLHAAIHGSHRLPFGPPEYKVIPVYPDAVHVDMVLHFAELYLKPWNEKSKLVWNELLTSRVQKVWLYKTSEGDQREFAVVEIACEQKRLVYLRLNRTHFPSSSSSTSSPGADSVDEEESSSSSQATTPKESHSTPELVTKKGSHSLSETTIAEGSHSSSQTTIPDELHSMSGTYVQTGSRSLSETSTQEESHSPSETAIPEGSLSSSNTTTQDELHSPSGTYVQTGSHSLSETIVQEEPRLSSENTIKEEKLSMSTTSLPSVDTSASAVPDGQPTTDKSIPYSPTLRTHVPHPNGYIAAYMMRRILTPPSSSYAKIVKCVSYSCKTEELPTFWELLILVNVIDEYSESYQLVERPFFWCVDMLCALLETWPRDFRDVKVDQFSFKKWYAMNSNLPYCGRENGKPVYRRKDEFVLQVWAAFKVRKEFLEQQVSTFRLREHTADFYCPAQTIRGQCEKAPQSP